MERTVAADPSAADLIQGFRATGLRLRRGIDPARPADLWALAGSDAAVRLAALRALGATTPAVIVDGPPTVGRAALEPVARVVDGSLIAFRDAASRARAGSSPTLLRIAGGIADLVRLRFVRGELDVDLSLEEADLLAYLAARAGRIVGRAELQVEVWGLARPRASTRAVDMAVVRIREHMGPACPLHDDTGGYRLDIRPAAAKATPAELVGRLGALGTAQSLELLADIEAQLPALSAVRGTGSRAVDAALCIAAWNRARGGRAEALAALSRVEGFSTKPDRQALAALWRHQLGESADLVDHSDASPELRARLHLERALDQLETAPKSAASILKLALKDAGPLLGLRLQATDRARVALGRAASRAKAIDVVLDHRAKLLAADAIHDALHTGRLAVRLVALLSDSERALRLAIDQEPVEACAPDRRLAATLAWDSAEAASAAGRTDFILGALDRYRSHLPEAEWSQASRLLRATTLLAIRRHGDVLDEIDALAPGRLAPPVGLRLQVLASLDQGRPRHALTLLEAAANSVRMAGDVALNGVLLGAARHQLGDLDGARRAYEEAGPLPDDPVASTASALHWALELERTAEAQQPTDSAVPDALLTALAAGDRRAIEAATRNDQLPVEVRIWARIALQVGRGTRR